LNSFSTRAAFDFGELLVLKSKSKAKQMLKKVFGSFQSLHLQLPLKTPRKRLTQAKVKPKASLRLVVEKAKLKMNFQSWFY
jgi:hypothetical protein